NVHGIVGMAKALEIVYSDMEEEQAKEKEMQIYLEEALKEEICNIKINCGNSRRISSVVNITLEDCNVQTLMVALDMEGICVSGGSACMSGAMETSHVLKAMGASEEDLKSSIRVSIGRYNTKDEIDIFIQKLKEIVARERAK
ncbi:MAG: aminotransferase class V-fold PLP-dependent enzyme, partial [Leptotrichiaceae bacterium]